MEIKLGLPGILTIAFVVLKLIGTIAWSWLWVLSPMWIGAGFTIIVLLLATLVVVADSWSRH